MRSYEQNAWTKGEIVITVIGAGGIGSNLVPHLARALRCGELIGKVGPVRLRVIDGDYVEERNLQHQNFTSENVDSYKTESIVRPLWNCHHTLFTIESIPENVRTPTFIATSDLVLVAVDSMEVRRLVHRYADTWLDLRCQGDGYIALDHRVDPVIVSKLTPLNGESTSCQLPGALKSGNIQFGHLLAGAHGAQWVLQYLRYFAGEVNAQPPAPQTANITFGTLGRFELHSPNLEPRTDVEPQIHSDDLLEIFVESEEHDSVPIRETLTAHAVSRDYQSLWNLADRLGREVSILFDADDKVWVDVGTAGQVRLAPPEGARIPFKLWIHTHPRDAYWSATDQDSLLRFSGILQEALVLGHDHLKRAVHLAEPTDECIEKGSALEFWTDEEITLYSEMEVVADGS